MLIVSYTNWFILDAIVWIFQGNGKCSGHWIGIGYPKSLKEAQSLMKTHKSCSTPGSILVYSGYSYDWGASCADGDSIIPYCNDQNGNWKRYLLAYGYEPSSKS